MCVGGCVQTVLVSGERAEEPCGYLWHEPPLIKRLAGWGLFSWEHHHSYTPITKRSQGPALTLNRFSIHSSMVQETLSLKSAFPVLEKKRSSCFCIPWPELSRAMLSSLPGWCDTAAIIKSPQSLLSFRLQSPSLLMHLGLHSDSRALCAHELELSVESS